MNSLATNSLRRILCLGAHSDDIEIGCGGWILKFIENNPSCQVFWSVFSGNSARKTEAKASANRFLDGVRYKNIRCAGFRESYFPSEWAAIKSHFEKIGKAFEPDLIFTHYRNDRHQDHRVISDLTWNTFRNHLILEYEILKYDGDLGQPNFFAPLEAEVVQKKIKIIRECFRSQADKQWFTDDAFLALMRIRGIECASTYAEAYYCRKMVI
jgi:LmbE family N-acetylglucosaminyl deacetylase